MNIGVFVPHQSQAIGGGYTFQSDVQAAIQSLNGTVEGHRFVMMECEPDPDVPTKLLWKGEQPVDLVWFIGPSAFLPENRPYVATIWDLQHRLQPWFPEVSRNAQWEAREALYTQWLRRASAIFVPNKVGSDEVSLFYHMPAERLHVLGHPTPSDALAAGRESAAPSAEPLRARYRLTKPYVLYPAQFWAHKNHRTVLEAWTHLIRELGRDYLIVFTGSDQGNENAVRKWSAELGLDNHVRYLGFVPRNELLALYKGAHALVYASYFGPENLPPLEAFAIGCPVVCTSYRGALEQLGDAAWFVPLDSPVAMAEALAGLDTPSVRATFVTKGLERASSWTATEFLKAAGNVFSTLEASHRLWMEDEPSQIRFNHCRRVDGQALDIIEAQLEAQLQREGIIKAQLDAQLQHMRIIEAELISTSLNVRHLKEKSKKQEEKLKQFRAKLNELRAQNETARKHNLRNWLRRWL